MDDNILGTSEQHFREVISMLKRQKERPVFSGGLEPQMLQQWQADLLREVNPKAMYTAYDTKDDLEAIVDMGKKLRAAGFTNKGHECRCYVLIGYPDDTIDEAEKRIHQAIDAGFFPFSMLYRDESGMVDKSWAQFNRQWASMVIAGAEYKKYLASKGGFDG